MGKTVALLLVPLLMVAGAILFLQRRAAQKQPTTSQRSTTSENSTPTETREVVVSGTEFAFNPSTITVKKGERIKLTFENKGAQAHDWVVEDLNLKTPTTKGSAQETIEFQAPDKEGSHNIICSVPGHKEAGMAGKLLVE